MSSALIYQWIESSSDYFAGVALFGQYGDNTTLFNLLKKNDGPYNRKRLTEVLKELAEKMDKAQEELDYNTSFAITPVPQIQYPDSLEEKIRLRKETYKEAGKIHAQLLYIEDFDQREKAVFEMHRLMKLNARFWRETEYFEKTGKEMPVTKQLVFPELSGLNSVELTRFIGNMRCNLSKWKKKAKEKPEKANQYRDNIAEGSTKLEQAILLLDAIQSGTE